MQGMPASRAGCSEAAASRGLSAHVLLVWFFIAGVIIVGVVGVAVISGISPVFPGHWDGQELLSCGLGGFQEIPGGFQDSIWEQIPRPLSSQGRAGAMLGVCSPFVRVLPPASSSSSPP